MDWAETRVLTWEQIMERIHRLRGRTGCYTEACAHAATLYPDDDEAAIKWLDAQRGKTRFWFRGKVPHEIGPGHWGWRDCPGVSWGHVESKEPGRVVQQQEDPPP